MIVRARSQANCSVSYKIQVIFHDKEFKNNYKNANITKIQTPYGKRICYTCLNADSFIIWKRRSENRKCTTFLELVIDIQWNQQKRLTLQKKYYCYNKGGASTMHEWYSSCRAELEIWRVLNKIDWLRTISLTSSLRKYRGMEKARKKG